MDQSVTVTITNGPLPPEPCRWLVPGAGAMLVFEGMVRPGEEGRVITALEYEAYRPMADRQLSQLAHDLLQKHSLLAVWVEHSEGVVAVGEISFRLRIASTHRKEGLQAMEEFIDRLKQDVPIWKQPRFASAEDLAK